MNTLLLELYSIVANCAHCKCCLFPIKTNKLYIQFSTTVSVCILPVFGLKTFDCTVKVKNGEFSFMPPLWGGGAFRFTLVRSSFLLSVRPKMLCRT